jgi:hypothetical protein
MDDLLWVVRPERGPEVDLERRTTSFRSMR